MTKEKTLIRELTVDGDQFDAVAYFLDRVVGKHDGAGVLSVDACRAMGEPWTIRVWRSPTPRHMKCKTTPGGIQKFPIWDLVDFEEAVSELTGEQ